MGQNPSAVFVLSKPALQVFLWWHLGVRGNHHLGFICVQKQFNIQAGLDHMKSSLSKVKIPAFVSNKSSRHLHFFQRLFIENEHLNGPKTEQWWTMQHSLRLYFESVHIVNLQKTPPPPHTHTQSCNMGGVELRALRDHVTVEPIMYWSCGRRWKKARQCNDSEADSDQTWAKRYTLTTRFCLRPEKESPKNLFQEGSRVSSAVANLQKCLPPKLVPGTR